MIQTVCFQRVVASHIPVFCVSRPVPLPPFVVRRGSARRFDALAAASLPDIIVYYIILHHIISY